MRLLLVALAGALAATGAAAAASGAPPDPPPAWVVGADDRAAARGLEAALAATGGSVERLPRLDAVAVSGAGRDEVLDALDGLDGVDYVERALPRALHGEPADAVDPATGRAFGWALAAVRAAEGIAAAGGGAPSSPVAVVDSGVDAHPDLAGRLLAGHDVLGGGSVDDAVGHGTFVAALVSAIDGNGIGGRGVAGATPVIPVRVTAGTGITSADLAAGIVAAVDRGARVVNLSLGGPGISWVEQAALDYARQRDVLVVASSGNGALHGNLPEYPAAAVGGESGGWSAGLSVAATDPLGRPAPFSTHNRNVSIAAPGAGMGGCAEGVYSAIPAGPASLWPGGPCDAIFSGHGAGRYAYGQGTSFSAPLVAGAGALVRHVAPDLRAEQVGDVLRRSAVQTLGAGWNRHTGAGVLDVARAVALAARYDTTAPAVALFTESRAGGVRVRASAQDATGPGRDPAGGATVTLETSRDGRTWSRAVAPTAGPIDVGYLASADRPLWLRATGCDANRNCAARASGPYAGAGAGGSTHSAWTGRLRGAILALGVSRRCPAGRARCVRLVVRAAPGVAGRVRFAVRVRQPGDPRVVARSSGVLTPGRRRVLSLVPRGPLSCGRIVAQLTLRNLDRAQTVSRRAPVRRCPPSIRAARG